MGHSSSLSNGRFIPSDTVKIPLHTLITPTCIASSNLLKLAQHEEMPLTLTLKLTSQVATGIGVTCPTEPFIGAKRHHGCPASTPMKCDHRPGVERVCK